MPDYRYVGGGETTAGMYNMFHKGIRPTTQLSLPVGRASSTA